MARVGGIGDAGQVARAISPQPQQTAPEAAPVQKATSQGRLDNPVALGYEELESQASAPRGNVAAPLQAQAQQQTQLPRPAPWPIRVYRATANVEDRPAPQSEQSPPPEEDQSQGSSRIDLMA